MKKTADFSYYLSKFLARYLPGEAGASPNTILSYRDTFFAVHKILQGTGEYASGGDDARTADKGTGMRVSLLARK
jgi:hypothetical protein